ncbi:MAG: radical protein [Streptosporangiaceae bacterium]|nr:radical protein [Streptosporangiaceae bacterium]
MSTTFVPLLPADAVAALPERAREVVEYRKSGLSLNHVQGCPLGCAYCIRHTYGLWDADTPVALMPDEEAVGQLVNHPYFTAHATPLQIFNRSTDPFLTGVRDHLFAVLEDLDNRGLTNRVLVITRAVLRRVDCERLNALKHLKVTLLFTYSGIEDRRVEPYPSAIAARSMRLASAYGTRDNPRRFRTVFYWRPLVPGLNDTARHLNHAAELSRFADATVFTGLFYRAEIAEYYRAKGIPEPYQGTARRKIVPETLERRVLAAFGRRPPGGSPLFRKTSCAVSYAHGLPDYNGHYGITELCDICPVAQVSRCAGAHQVPTAHELQIAAASLPEAAGLRVFDIDERAAQVEGLPSEQPRYYLQHAFAFQVHDAGHPHRQQRHGRAEIGWEKTDG